MADISDVLTSLAILAASIAYPNGTGNPSITGAPVMVYPGWPVPNQLNTDIAAGKAHISIFPRPEERNTSRYPSTWKAGATTPATITMAITGQTVTLAGMISTPQACMVVINDSAAYSYLVQQNDTLATISAALAAQIVGATSVGAVITLPTGKRPSDVHVITTGSATKEIRRQERLVALTVWAPNPAARDSICKTIDAALAATPRTILADQSVARLTYKGSPVTDMLEKSNIYRRDLLYTVEYATTITGTFYTVGNTKINLSTSQAGVS